MGLLLDEQGRCQIGERRCVGGGGGRDGGRDVLGLNL